MHKAVTCLLASVLSMTCLAATARAAEGDWPQVVPYDPDDDDGGGAATPIEPSVRRRSDAPSGPSAAAQPSAVPTPSGVAAGARRGTAAETRTAPGAGGLRRLTPVAVPVPSPQGGGGNDRTLAQPVREVGLGCLQFLVGAATWTGTIALGVSLDDDALAVVAVLLSPLTVAGSVSLVGLASQHSRGRLGPTIGLAYLGGTLGAILGLAVLMSSNHLSEGDVVAGISMPVLGIVSGALLGWHGFKSPIRPGRAAASPAEYLPRALAHDDRGAGVRLTVPLLSLGF